MNTLKINLINNEQKAQPDPYILRFGNEYYVYCTNSDGVTVYRSTDFENFTYLGFALREQHNHEYWAPCVVERSGMFYMYYSCIPKTTNDVHLQRLKVACSGKPEGPFEFVNNLLPPFSIDAQIAENENGESFIFYSVNKTCGERVGTYIAVDKMVSPFEVEGKPVEAVMPTLDEEIFQRDRFRDGEHWHTVEGAYYFREGDYHYLTYSGNCYENENYFVGYAVAKGNESDLRKLKFQKYPTDDVWAPILKKNSVLEGTGHNSGIKIGDERYIVFHGRKMGEPRMPYDTRTINIAKMKAEGGKITVY